jgi:hypothetical protein
MQEEGNIRISFYAIGLGRIRQVHELTVAKDATFRALCIQISKVLNGDVSALMVAAQVKALDMSQIGRRDFRTGKIHSKHPDAVPEFVLKTNNADATVIECGLYDGAKIMCTNGEMD